jgi:hypothetical protein
LHINGKYAWRSNKEKIELTDRQQKRPKRKLRKLPRKLPRRISEGGKLISNAG